ncbi:thiamine phosphate synthase [Psychrobacter sp. I-STPA10]|uniref:thiamine phosphate synthase n=1 Tax=Psychrobacter sp. I-STPA10 TaxID=2585769 RepID=UPI001E403E41|nr:thiamine phosphate synthase [Psychrobacter sp. I-STPA10]
MLTTAKKASPSLYLLTNEEPFTLLYDKLNVAFASGVVDLLQVRRKATLQQGRAALYQEAKQLTELANQYGIAVIINDDMTLAHELGVGVHLGKEDGQVAKARQLLGAQAIIGASCYGSVALVEQAKVQGATYAALGAIFASSTKPTAKVINHSILQDAIKCDIDLCVIGGITAENICLLQHYSLRYVAVVSDILQYPIEQTSKRCQQWQDALSSWQ